jgi:hypothetical protein
MNDSAHTPAGGPSAIAVIDEYFAQLVASATATKSPLGQDELAELRSYVDERLSATSGTADDATRVLAGLGAPQALARAFAEADEDGTAGATPARATVGRVLGVPYDLRPPSSERFATRVWDPTDSRVLVPKALGVGWTVNLGALAVKAHLIRPDDEDAPFTATPEGAVRATLAAPIAVVVTLGVLIAVRWSGLPATVPVHWGITGQADGYGSRGGQVLVVALVAMIPLLAAVWVHARGRQAFSRIAASAVSLGFADIALTIFVQTLFSVDGGSGVWPTWVGIAGFVVLPLLLLVVVSRIGRAAEQRHDMSASSKGRTQ